MLGAERGGGEVGPDRQRRERDGDVVGELGVGARVGAAGVAAPLIERAVDGGDGHVAEQRGRRAGAGPVGRRGDQVGLGALSEDVAQSLDLRVAVEDGDDAAAAAPEDALAAAQRVELAGDVAVDVVDEERQLVGLVVGRAEVTKVVALGVVGVETGRLVERQRLAEDAVGDRAALRIGPQPDWPMWPTSSPAMMAKE